MAERDNRTVFQTDPDAPQPRRPHCYGSHRNRSYLTLQYFTGEPRAMLLELTHTKLHQLIESLDALKAARWLSSYTFTPVQGQQCPGCIMQTVLEHGRKLIERERAATACAGDSATPPATPAVPRVQ